MRVAVLAGGRSLERAVSQRSGARVELALRRLGHEPVMLDADADARPAPGRRAARRRDRRHPRPRRRGRHRAGAARAGRRAVRRRRPGGVRRRERQDRHEAPAARGRAADRRRSRRSPPVPCATSAPTRCSARIGDRVGLPLVVKPARGGSSLGVAPRRRRVGACRRRCCPPSPTTTTCCASGSWTAARSPSRCSPTRRCRRSRRSRRAPRATTSTPATRPGATEFVVPAEIGPESAEAALAACRVIGCAAFARVDLLLPADAPPQILELNTVPGPDRDQPHAARRAGRGHDVRGPRRGAARVGSDRARGSGRCPRPRPGS